MCGCSFRLQTEHQIVNRTSMWREKNQAFQLLVSFIKPHNAVAKSRVPGWVKQIIMSGINTDIFKHIPIVQYPHHMRGSLVYHNQDLGQIKLHGKDLTTSLS